MALRLAADLKKSGAHVWLDRLDIRPGRQWDREVELALNACSEMLVILTQSAIDSENVMDEIGYALEERKTVIPLLFEDCRVPFRLRRVQYVDFRTSYDEGLTQLLATLHAEKQLDAVAHAAAVAEAPVPSAAPPSETEQAEANQAPDEEHLAHEAAEAAQKAEQAESARIAEREREDRETAEAVQKAEQEPPKSEDTEAAEPTTPRTKETPEPPQPTPLVSHPDQTPPPLHQSEVRDRVPTALQVPQTPRLKYFPIVLVIGAVIGVVLLLLFQLRPNPASVQTLPPVYSPPAPQPKTIVVSKVGAADFGTIGEATKAANPGDKISIRPGLYKEGLIIDKSVEIAGDGKLGDVIIEATGSNAVTFVSEAARISNLTLRQRGGGKFYGIDVPQGKPEIEGCDITSRSLSCVGIHAGADPILRHNRIHDCAEAGVVVFDSGKGTLEDNDIFRNTLVGVEIKTGANPTLRRNRIHDGKQGGVLIWNKGEGTLEKNEIFGNAGVGVELRFGCWPKLTDNTITKNKYEAIWVNDYGGGEFLNNDLRGNGRKGAWDIDDKSLPNVKRSGNIEK